MSKANKLHELNVLRLEDQSVYKQYAQNSTCPVTSWWAQFPYYWSYSLVNKRQSLWKIIDELFVPFIFSGKHLSILCIPFGEGSPDAYIQVLKKSLSLCALQNGNQQRYTYVKWMTEDQEQFLRQSSDFENLFHVRHKKSVGPEYHYSIDALRKVEGKKFAYLRRKINNFRKKHPNIVIRRYDSHDYPQLLELYNAWLSDAENNLGTIFDKAYYPAILQKHELLDHIVLVAEEENTIVGMISGGLTPNGQSYCFFRKSLHKYNGLAETLVLELAHVINKQDSNVELLNDGGTGLKPGLVHFKERFRPKLLLARSSLYIGSLNILQKASYPGPNIVGYSPSARLVLDGGEVDLFRKLPEQVIQRLNLLITKALGPDANDLNWELENCLAKIIAQLAILIQQAARHPVKGYGAQKTASGSTEIYFDLLRPKLLGPLIKCIQAFWQSGILLFHEDLFVNYFRANRDDFGFRLNELIVWDRIIAAHRLGIEARPGVRSTVWLGRGQYSRLTSMGYTQKTPRLADKIAGNKAESYRLMQEKELPLPQQIVARNKSAAVEAAKTIGYPVVVKPRYGSKGKGVAVNLTNSRAVMEAFDEASNVDDTVVVESFINGDDYRLLVENDRFIAAVKRVPARVVGDGVNTINDLMSIANSNERRDGLYLYPLQVDSEVRRLLQEQSLNLEDIPEKGQVVRLRNTANVSRGGTTVDVTDFVHPDNRAVAVSAAKSCLLDVAGIDFQSTDITRSWRDGYGKIIEINAGPGGDLHLQPTVGAPREVSYQMIRTHFPSQRQERIPLIFITGFYGKNYIARACAGIWSRLGMSPGILLKDQLILGTNTVTLDDNFNEQMAVLDRHSEIDAAVVTRSIDSLIKEGLCAERITCAVLSDDRSKNKLSKENYDSSIDVRGYRLLADMATNGVVIDGRSKILDEAVAHLPPENIVKIWARPYESLPDPIIKHLEKGGLAMGITISGQDSHYQLNWYEKNNSSHLMSIPRKMGKSSKVKSLMMAIGASLISTTSLKRLQPTLFEYDSLIGSTTLNSLITDICPKNNIQVASALPNDIDAMETFCDQLNPKDRLWVVASSKPGMFSEWKNWRNTLADRQVFYMLESGQDRTEVKCPSQSFSTLESAWHHALCFAQKNDSILLLVTDNLLRRKIFNTRPKQSVRSHICSKSPLWSAETLAEIFQGTWINGPDSGWGVNEIGWGSNMAGPDMLTILPGVPDQKAAVTAMEKRLENVIEEGGRAAISPVISSKLPRWKAVMQADDTLGGMLRLGEYARSRIQGVVIAMYSPEDILQARLKEMGAIFSRVLNQHIYVSHVHGDNSGDDVITTALALANAGEDYPVYFFPWVRINQLTKQMLHPDFIVLDCTSSTKAPDKELSSCLSEESNVFALIHPDAKDRWRKLGIDCNCKINLMVTSSMPRDHKSERERVADALIDSVIHEKS